MLSPHCFVDQVLPSSHPPASCCPFSLEKNPRIFTTYPCFCYSSSKSDDSSMFVKVYRSLSFLWEPSVIAPPIDLALQLHVPNSTRNCGESQVDVERLCRGTIASLRLPFAIFPYWLPRYHQEQVGIQTLALQRIWRRGQAHILRSAVGRHAGRRAGAKLRRLRYM
jgi:hypothetical protein